MDTLDLLNEVYSNQKQNFQSGSPSFHNLLWQLLINEAWKGHKTHCFVPVVSNIEGADGFEVGIIEDGEQGYFPTRVFFKEGLKMDTCNNICDVINEKVFGLLPTTTMEILSTTMRYIASN